MSSTPTVAAGTTTKRVASDAIARLSLLASSFHNDHEPTTTTLPPPRITGRGSTAGWTTCPLCHHNPNGSNNKNRKYAVGRGMAMHLEAVHTPWQAQARRSSTTTKKRRKMTRHQQEQPATADADEALPPREPTQQERDDWDAMVLQILQETTRTAAVAATTSATATGGAASTDTASANTTATVTLPPGWNRNGTVSQPYRQSLPPFLQAAARGDLPTLQQMVASADAQQQNNHIALIQQHDRHGSTAEQWAAGNGHLDCLKYLHSLEQQPPQPQESSSPGTTSSTAVTKKLGRRDGKTALHYAARNGQVSCLDYLVVSKKWDVDARSGDGTTPLHLACFGGHPDAVQWLLDRGAQPAWRNDWGCHTAHWLAMTKNTDSIEQLCYILQKQGVSFVEQQTQGHSALHKACQHLNRPMVEWMARSAKEGGAALTEQERIEAGQCDQGGHRPSDIWRSVGGSESFATWMRDEMNW